MADWWPFDRSWADELKRNWTEVLNMSSAAAQSLGLPQPGFLPGDPFGAIVDAARTWLVGKRRTIRFSGHELTMVLTDISVEGSELGRALGQYDQVRFTARDVRLAGHQFERVEVRARNVHLRPGPGPVLVVAPVLVEAFVAAPVASRWLASRVPPAGADHAGRHPAGRPGQSAMGAPGGGSGRRRRIPPRPAAGPAPARAAAVPALPGFPPAVAHAAQWLRADLGRARPRRLRGAGHDERVAAPGRPR